jgi:hypothetical protein
MLYEKLNDEMRAMVDHYAVRLAPLPWPTRSGLLAEAAVPFAEEFEDEGARLAAQGFLTAVLERLDGGAVEDPHHARLLTLSLNPYHRAMAECYFAANPHVSFLLAGGIDGETVH